MIRNKVPRKPVSVRLTEPVYDQLIVMAVKEDISLDCLIRKACVYYIEKQA